MGTDPGAPSLHAIVEPSEIQSKTGLAFPHTIHCLASGELMVSCMGDKEGNADGSGYLLLNDDFTIKGRWEAVDKGDGEVGEKAAFGYDFWYQPRHNTMISSSWGAPKIFSAGFNPAHVAEGHYGRALYVWDWEKRRVKQTLDLGLNGWLPLEVRFLHNPDRAEGFVGAALSSTLIRFFKKEDGEWATQVRNVIPKLSALKLFARPMWRFCRHPRFRSFKAIPTSTPFI